MPKVGVLLSGCGVFDGAEIHESVCTLLALDQRGVDVVCCAPNVDFDVIDHTKQEPTGEKRNVLVESARIARGEIRDVAQVSASELDALILPGGFGAAKNLSDFAVKGPDCTVQPDVLKLVGDCLAQGKPVGAICIAPATLAKICSEGGVQAKVTIGNDAGTAGAISKLHCTHQECAVTDIAVDTDHKIVSTPAYMLGPGPAKVNAGIVKLVEKVLEMI